MNSIKNSERAYSIACDRNRGPIFSILKKILPDTGRVLEVGSGSGQHISYFSSKLPNLDWLPSDLPQCLPDIRGWCEDSNENCLPPVALDLLSDDIEFPNVSAVICINVVHIVSWVGVQNLFSAVSKCLNSGGVFYLYGPYRYSDKDLEPTNEEFDSWLKMRDAESGIRDFNAINELALSCNLRLDGDFEMPANNRSLCFIRD